MLPDLGKYADVVIWSYLVSIIMIAGLVVWSLWRGAQIKRALAQIEARASQSHKGGGDAP